MRDLELLVILFLHRHRHECSYRGTGCRKGSVSIVVMAYSTSMQTYTISGRLSPMLSFHFVWYWQTSGGEFPISARRASVRIADKLATFGIVSVIRGDITPVFIETIDEGLTKQQNGPARCHIHKSSKQTTATWNQRHDGLNSVPKRTKT